MLSEEFTAMGALSPETLGGSPVALMLYVEDVDAYLRRQYGREQPSSVPCRIISTGTAAAWYSTLMATNGRSPRIKKT